MKRLQKYNINTPERFNESFLNWDGFKKGKEFDYSDKERLELLTKHYKGGNFIDLGCLNSPLAVETKKQFPNAEVWALDFASEIINYYKPKYPKVKWIVGDVMKIPAKDEYFDYVVAGELIEHMETPEAFVKEAIRIVKKSGILAISTPYKETSLGEVSEEEHLWSFNMEDLSKLLRPYGNTELFYLGTTSHPVALAWCFKT